MRKSVKALHLSSETLRHLVPSHLEIVAGGFSVPAVTCGTSNQTCDPCNTYSCAGPRQPNCN